MSDHDVQPRWTEPGDIDGHPDHLLRLEAEWDMGREGLPRASCRADVRTTTQERRERIEERWRRTMSGPSWWRSLLAAKCGVVVGHLDFVGDFLAGG